jgi:hypothetical protein
MVALNEAEANALPLTAGNGTKVQFSTKTCALVCGCAPKFEIAPVPAKSCSHSYGQRLFVYFCRSKLAFNRAGFRSMIAIRNRSCPISSLQNQKTM